MSTNVFRSDPWSRPPWTFARGVRPRPRPHPHSSAWPSGRPFRAATVLLLTLLIAGGASAQAQEAATLEKLAAQLQQMQANFDRQQREMRESFERTLREQRTEIDALKRDLANARASGAAAAVSSTQPPANPSTPTATPTGQPAATPLVSSPATTLPNPTPSAPWSPTQPIRIGGEKNYLNLSLDALVAAGGSTANDIPQLETGGHDPNQRGFTVQNLETVFEGMVDPYFRGQANIVLQIDSAGETTIEAEEAYLETMSLPWNLQVKAGQFFEEFGRLNASHPHTWDFVDQPLVNGRFLGPDGLRSAGARLSWLVPTPFYSEIFLAVANSQGETAYSFRNSHDDELFMGRPTISRNVESLGDLLFVPRYVTSFNLTDAQTIMAGASAAFGPNSSGEDSNTQIYGLDLLWKWKSPRQHAGFPFVTWQTEAMARRYHAAAYAGDAYAAPPLPSLPAETLTDWGFYSQIVWGFHKGWTAGLRGDYVWPGQTGEYETILGPDPARAMRWRVSPNLTFYPSEFSKLRLQYNYDQRDGIGVDHSIWMQFEILLGSHAAHKF